MGTHQMNIYRRSGQGGHSKKNHLDQKTSIISCIGQGGQGGQGDFSPIAHARTRARVCISFFILLLIFYYYKKCLDHLDQHSVYGAFRFDHHLDHLVTTLTIALTRRNDDGFE
jgi:hypothetical protein